MLVLGVVRGCGLITPSLGTVPMHTVYPLTEPTAPAIGHIPLAIEGGAAVEVVRQQWLPPTGAKEVAVWTGVKKEPLMKDLAILCFYQVLVGAGEKVHVGNSQVLFSNCQLCLSRSLLLLLLLTVPRGGSLIHWLLFLLS